MARPRFHPKNGLSDKLAIQHVQTFLARYFHLPDDGTPAAGVPILPPQPAPAPGGAPGGGGVTLPINEEDVVFDPVAGHEHTTIGAAVIMQGDVTGTNQASVIAALSTSSANPVVLSNDERINENEPARLLFQQLLLTLVDLFGESEILATDDLLAEYETATAETPLT